MCRLFLNSLQKKKTTHAYRYMHETKLKYTLSETFKHVNIFSKLRRSRVSDWPPPVKYNRDSKRVYRFITSFPGGRDGNINYIRGAGRGETMTDVLRVFDGNSRCLRVLSRCARPEIAPSPADANVHGRRRYRRKYLTCLGDEREGRRRSSEE